MKLAICDDERICREELIKLLNEYIAVNPGKDISFSEFSNADNLLDSASAALDFDIYILDIVMPGLSGIELGKTLRSMGSKGKIIYLTSSEEFAVDSYKVKAANYILKPVCKEELFSALDDIISEISENEEKSLIVKTADSITRVTYNSILYAELVKKSVVYHLTDGNTIESTNIRTGFSKAVEELHRDKQFVLCGSSMLVNLSHVKSVQKDSLIFTDGRILYLPKASCIDIRSAWIDYWLEAERSNI